MPIATSRAGSRIMNPQDPSRRPALSLTESCNGQSPSRHLSPNFSHRPSRRAGPRDILEPGLLNRLDRRIWRLGIQ